MPALKQTLIFIFILTASVSCSVHVETPKDRVDRAYKKIDRGEHDQAIQELEELLLQIKGDSIRQALASAYAARAGVSIDGYWKFMASFAFPNWEYGNLNQRFIMRAVDELKKDSEQSESPFISTGRSMESVLQALSLIQEYAYRMELLPVLDEWPNADLDRSLELLGEVDRKEKGAYLYRSLLRMIVIKTLVVQKAQKFRMKDERDQCLIRTDHLKKGIEVVGAEVRNLVYDLKRVYPSHEKKFEQHDQYLRMLLAAIVFVPDELDLRDHDLTLVNMIFQLDKALWRCR